MDRMLIHAEDEDGRSFFLSKVHIESQLQEGRIRRFRRASGWVDRHAEERREDQGGYSGPERRLSRRINWNLFSLPVVNQLRRGCSLETILGDGEAAREIAVKLANVARTNLSVLIQGKTGTGKGLAAQILHEMSPRKDKPFIRVDCGTIPPTLIESELFGYEKGSFTGAFRSKPGRFQMANGGTTFLDEIANLSMEMQTRLLGFLEERIVSSIGGVTSVKLDVRIISATNADLVDQVRKYQFREDLYYRLAEFEIRMPCLRERPDDLFFLATKFLIMANAELQKKVWGFSEEALDFISQYEWPGNIRELKNCIKRAVLLADDIIEVEHLLGSIRNGQMSFSLDACLENAFAKGRSLHEILDMIGRIAEEKIIKRVYEQSRGNKRKTCEALGIDYSTLFRKKCLPLSTDQAQENS